MKKLFFILMSILCSVFSFAQAEKDFSTDMLPLKKVTLYSSGVGHYEHEGHIKGSKKIELLFSVQQINDVLKSMVVFDPQAKKLSIDYQSENTLTKALESLKINLAAYRSFYDILNSRRGAEVELFTQDKIRGKILSVERKAVQNDNRYVEYLSLFSDGKVRLIPFSGIHSFRFTDEKLNTDLNTALDLVSENASNNRKSLTVNLKTENSLEERNVKISYVMEAPVWKAAYRLNTDTDKAEFQAWAIIDNSSDIDWKNISLTLTTGKPVAFIQNLYAPYYTHRPELPLLIAGAAAPKTFESGNNAYADNQGYEEADMMYEERVRSASEKEKRLPFALKEDLPDTPYFENQLEKDSGGSEIFSFTPAFPVSLERQKSTMLPLALVSVPSEKISVFSGLKQGAFSNPKLCLNIKNTSGLKLPAGPVTVFDGGKYAGDAVLEFLPIDESRLIAYGDDMEVRGTMSDNNSKYLESVKMADGLLTVYYKTVKETEYTVKNSSASKRKIIIEHPVYPAFKLVTGKNLLEKTADMYRFKFEPEAGKEEKLNLKEEKITWSNYQALKMNDDFFVSIASNKEISAEVKKTFTAILGERKKLNALKENLSLLQKEQTNLSAEQERTRKNIGVFGKEDRQGKEFITKLLSLEKNLEELAVKITEAQNNLNLAEKQFAEFIKGINLQ